MQTLNRHTLRFVAELRDRHAARSQCIALEARQADDVAIVETTHKLFDGELIKRSVDGRPDQWVIEQRTLHRSWISCRWLPLDRSDVRRRWGSLSLQPCRPVTIHRVCWRCGPLRLLIDRVKTLGDFLMVEIDVPDPQARETHAELLKWARQQFQPVLGEALLVGYSDLLERQVDLQGDLQAGLE